jgi:hypothetical protein
LLEIMMASIDEERQHRRDDYIDQKTVNRAGSPVAAVGWIVIALVVAAFIGWYVFAGSSDEGTGITRTAPVTSSPNTGTNTTSNPATTPKQP